MDARATFNDEHEVWTGDERSIPVRPKLMEALISLAGIVALGKWKHAAKITVEYVTCERTYLLRRDPFMEERIVECRESLV
jgi:hypothetical protein